MQEPQFQQASQHFAALMEGKVSNIPGTDATYSYLKWMITRIIKSGYFDRIREETAMATSDVLRNIAPAPARIDQVLYHIHFIHPSRSHWILYRIQEQRE